MSDYEHTPAPQRIDGVNEGIKLLQRRVFQYNGFAQNQGAVETQNAVYGTKASMASGGVSNQTLSKFFQINFTPSSDNTAIMVKMQMHIYGTNNLSYHIISVTPMNQGGANSNYIPEYGWYMGSTNDAYGHPPMSPCYWYNSWGKDISAKIEWRMNGHPTYPTYTRNPSYTHNAMLNSPNMVIEEWENGNPNGPTVQFTTHRQLGVSSGNTNTGQVHPTENETGFGYEYKEDGWDASYDPYHHNSSDPEHPLGSGSADDTGLPEE